jgi:hypothetical protein
MAKHSAQSIGTIISEFLRGTEVETALLERKVPELWKQVLGGAVAQFTGEIEVKNGTLFVHIHSAALRQHLFENRYLILKKLNAALNANLLKDIRLLG